MYETSSRRTQSSSYLVVMYGDKVEYSMARGKIISCVGKTRLAERVVVTRQATSVQNSDFRDCTEPVHPCAGARLIFSVSSQCSRMIPEGNPTVPNLFMLTYTRSP